MSSHSGLGGLHDCRNKLLVVFQILEMKTLHPRFHLPKTPRQILEPLIPTPCGDLRDRQC
jgi:hypothetical protein